MDLLPGTPGKTGGILKEFGDPKIVVGGTKSEEIWVVTTNVLELYPLGRCYIVKYGHHILVRLI